jgi:glycosyl transferase family 2
VSGRVPIGGPRFASLVPHRGLAGGVRQPLAPSPARSPRVSVTIASYNYGRFLEDCLASVVAQEGVELEVIVVDDASSDDTPAVARAFAARDPRVRLIRHERNRGHIATFNEGLMAASGDYVLKLDADDMLTPGALARAARVMEANPDIGLVYGRPHHFEGSPPPTASEPASACVVWSGRDWLAERCRTGFNCISNPEALVRAALLPRLGYYRPELPHTFDFEMWMRLAAVSDVGRIEGPAQGLYRIHPQSFQRTVHSGVLVDFKGRRDAFDAVFAGPGAALADAPELHARARARIARQALDQACRAYDRGRVGREPVPELVDFALETWPEAAALPEWRALGRRRRVGERHAHLVPPFVMGAGLRRLREQRVKARWQRRGL